MAIRVRQWLTPQEVGNLTGFSAQFIRTEIKAHALPAQWVQAQSSKMGRYRIHRDDALAYARKLGVDRNASAV